MLIGCLISRCRRVFSMSFLLLIFLNVTFQCPVWKNNVFSSISLLPFPEGARQTCANRVTWDNCKSNVAHNVLRELIFQDWSSLVLVLHCHSNHFVCFFSSPYPPLSICIEKYNFLGISIVGQSNDRGDGGIYIGSIMKGGAVAADGRIEPGDMLLQVGPCPTICAAGLYIGGSAQSSHQIHGFSNQLTEFIHTQRNVSQRLLSLKPLILGKLCWTVDALWETIFLQLLKGVETVTRQINLETKN